MSGLVPVVRYLIACEDVVVDPINPRKISLINLLSTIRSVTDPPFPVRHPELCVFVQLTGCRGVGRVAIRIIHADSGAAISSSPEKTANLGIDPLAVVALSFRMRACPFPAPGLYYIQFDYDGISLAQQPLLLE